jgi:hypothetical protein
MLPHGMSSSVLHSAVLFALCLQGAAGFIASAPSAATSSSQLIQRSSSSNAKTSSSQLRMVLAEAPALESLSALEKKPMPSFGETGA